MSFKLRKYQEDGIQACLDILQSKKQCREIVIAPTGAGKSIYLAEVAKQLDEPLLILQPSKELLKQNYSKFIKVGGKATICCASLKTKTIKGEDYTEIDGKLIKCREVSRVTFGTVRTVKNYVNDLKKLGVKKIAVDEAHLMTQSNTQKRGNKTVEKPAQIKKLVKDLGVKNIVGVTATALYLKGGLEGAELKMMNRVRWKLFTGIRYITQISELVNAKPISFWSKLIYQINETDETALKHNTSGSDYTVESLKEFYKSNNLKEQVIEEIQNLKKEGRKSILVFLSSIEEADELNKSFPEAEIVHSKITDTKRDYIIKGFKNKEIQIVLNINILSTGFDHPELDAIITVRPTSSIAVFYQQIGRGVRIHPSKKDCKVVDFSGNVSKFGIVEELHYEDIPYYGYGLFNGRNELLTNYPIAAKIRPTKESLIEAGKNKEKIKLETKQREKERSNPIISFGMYKGKRFWSEAKGKESKRFHSWCIWIYGEHKKGKWNFYGKEGLDLKKNIEEYLHKHATEFNL